MVATAVTLNDLEGHSPLADVFKCNPSNICAAFYTISTDSVLAWFLCSSRASCLIYLSAQWFTLRLAVGLCSDASASKFNPPVDTPGMNKKFMSFRFFRFLGF